MDKIISTLTLDDLLIQLTEEAEELVQADKAMLQKLKEAFKTHD